jgi:hypothetical protein
MGRIGTGSVMLYFLIILALLSVMALVRFQSAVFTSMVAQSRYSHQQKVCLLEGLLRYGICVCKINKKILLDWGSTKAQTMYLTFSRWPNCSSVKSLGGYAGFVSIGSDKGVLTVNAILSRADTECMKGQCVLKVAQSTPSRQSLCVHSWRLLND